MTINKSRTRLLFFIYFSVVSRFYFYIIFCILTQFKPQTESWLWIRIIHDSICWQEGKILIWFPGFWSSVLYMRFVVGDIASFWWRAGKIRFRMKRCVMAIWPRHFLSLYQDGDKRFSFAPGHTNGTLCPARTVFIQDELHVALPMITACGW